MANRKLNWFYIITLFVLTGCMGGRTLVLDIHYDTTRKPPPALTGLKAVVIPFEDRRPGREIGKWIGFMGNTDRFGTQRPVDETITWSVAEYLRKTGLEVSMVEKGSSPEGFKTIPPHFVITGRIEELGSEARSYMGYTQVKTRVRLNVDIRNVKDGSVFTVSVESLSEPKTVVAFNARVFEDTLNDALSDGLERILAGVNLEGEVLRPKR